MRSSKSRSRSRSNRSKPTGGNIINRVFDSSGPEGKVRGTPQQIIDKYNQLARDAQLSGDRVATENFQQHAEHYLRLLSEAQKEADAKREEQERHNRERQAQRDRERTERQDRDTPDQPSSTPEPARHEQPARHEPARHEPPRNDPAELPQPDVMEVAGDDGDSGLVETPESKVEEVQEKPKRTRRKPAPRKKDDAPKGEDAPKADEAPKAEAAPKKRAPAKKKTPAASDGGDEPSQAAE